jgi:hypothetical protein
VLVVNSLTVQELIMADEIRRLDYYSVRIPNKVGEGARVLGALRDAGVNLTGFWGYQTRPSQAQLELAPDDNGSFKKAARKAGLKLGEKHTAFLLSGEDHPGAVADVLDRLAQAGISVVAVKAICGGAGRFGAAFFVAPDDARKAAKALAAG